MATYIGFYYVSPEFAREMGQQSRSGEVAIQPGQNVPPRMAQKVRELPSILPQGCRLIGSYARAGFQSPDAPEEHQWPGIMIVETENATHLATINAHYAGYLAFAWYPYTPVART